MGFSSRGIKKNLRERRAFIGRVETKTERFNSGWENITTKGRNEVGVWIWGNGKVNNSSWNNSWRGINSARRAELGPKHRGGG